MNATQWFRLALVLCLLFSGAMVAEAGHWHHHSHSEYHSGDAEDCDDGDDGSLYVLGGILAAYVGSAPWWAPPSVINDSYRVDGRFPRHPYEDGHGGFMVLDDDYTLGCTPTGNLFFRASAEAGSNFSGIDRLAGNFHLETRQRLGLDIDWATYSADPGSNAPGNFDVGDANLIFRFAQSEHAQWWTGVGFSWLDEAGLGLEYGYNITYGTDICVGNPWVVSFQFDAGEIQHNSYFHGRATIGAQWNGVEIFTGFDYVDANVSDAATLVAGLRLWF